MLGGGGDWQSAYILVLNIKKNIDMWDSNNIWVTFFNLEKLPFKEENISPVVFKIFRYRQTDTQI